jgi:hypothetical protein
MIKYLTLELLESLPTKRLLAYYKKTYKKVRQYQDSFYCSCCGAPVYQTDGKLYTKEEQKKRKEHFEKSIADSENYINSIKLILNTRENVQTTHKLVKKKKKKKN